MGGRVWEDHAGIDGRTWKFPVQPPQGSRTPGLLSGQQLSTRSLFLYELHSRGRATVCRSFPEHAGVQLVAQRTFPLFLKSFKGSVR